MSKRSKKQKRHHDRTVNKQRLTVRLSAIGDYPHGDVVMAEVRGWGAHEWADHDQTIAGDSWETAEDMPGFAYAMPVNHPGLVAELRAEGYRLDLSEYPDFDPESCGDESCEHCKANS